jgi:hypothetical protein
MGLVHTLTRPQRLEQRVPLWVVSEAELPSDEGITLFSNLEDVVWRLEDLRPPSRKKKKADSAADDSDL